MAEEKLGTLQYDMLVNQKKLDDQLEDITKKLQEKDKQWKEILSGQGNVITPKINISDLGNLTKANEAIAVANNAVAKSTDAIKSKISELRTELKKNITAYEDMDAAERKAGGASKLSDIQSQKDQLVDLWKAYRQATTDKREASKNAIKAAREEEDALRSLERQRSDAFVKIENQKQKQEEALKKITAERLSARNTKEALVADTKYAEQLKKGTNDLRELSALNDRIKNNQEAIERINKAKKDQLRLDAEISRAAKKQIADADAQVQALNKIAIKYNAVKQDPIAKINTSTEYLKQQLKSPSIDNAEIKRLNELIEINNQKRKALISTLRDQVTAERQLNRETKLQLAVDAQEAGSIARLRAEIALNLAKIAGTSTSTQAGRDEIIKLNQAISDNRNQIQSLQPTLGIWGKLTSAIRTYATAYLSVQAVLGLGRAVYGQTKELDSLDFSMKTVIKSSTELAQTQKFLSEVAVNYGGDLLTLSERYIKFRAAAVQSNVSAAQTQKIFESVSKAAGTLGLRTDELSGTYLALEQMLSKGKVTTEELRRQLGERLPGAFGIMANALGVTIPELDKMLKKGEVLSTVALPKFAAALEKAYGIESLKKIDTLAAAQGRLSTEFTGLIKGIGASDTFKAVINGMASFIGLVKDNIGTIGLLTKAMLSVVAVTSIYRLRILAAGVAQFTMIALTNNQNIATNRLSGSMLSAAVSINTATRSWKAFGAALASNWVGLLLTGISVLVTSLISFKKNSEEATSAVVELGKEYSKSINNVNLYLRSIEKASKTSGEYKEALRGLNDISIKYNSTLLTEKSGLDEINSKRKDLIALITEEYLKKKQIIDLESSTAQRDAALDPIRKEFYEAFKYVENGAIKASLAYEKFLDAATDTRNRTSFAKQLADDTGINFGRMYGYLRDAAKALNKFRRDQEVQTQYYSQPLKGIEFKSEDIEAAKKEFEEYEKLKKRSEQGLLDPTFVTEQSKTYREWIENQIYLFKKLGDNTAVKELTVALVDLDKAEGKSVYKAKNLAADRAEAIKKLNDKYLADQEDFANYEMGIQATRIANMEDGLDKEIKLNELAYEKRIAAIEKEKIATIKLLNEAAGIRVGSAQEIKTLDATGYGKEVQDQASKAREADLQKRKNAENDLREANLKSEKDYQIKINEIRRDANDQFLSGIQKEKAAINEKYDEWVRKATTNKKLVDEIESSRRVAISEVDRQNAIDRLDFEREIEYKKNEIRLKGNEQSEKLSRANFETYYKYELKRGKLLLQSVNIDKQQEGRDVLNKLLQDVTLNNLDKEAELRKQILAYADDLFESLSKILGLTEQEAKALKGSFDALKKAASGDIVGGTVEATMNLFNIVLDSYTQGKEKRDAFYESAIAQQKDYNLLLNEQLRLSSEIDGTLFFTNIKDKIASSVSALKDANENYIEAFSKLSDASAIVGTKKVVDWANVAAGSVTGIFGALVGLFGGKKTVNVLAPLLETYPELLDANNKFNISLAESLIKNNQLEESSAKIVQNVIDWAKAAEEAKKQLDGVITDLVGSLGSDLETSLVSAFTEGTDSAIAFGGAVGNVIDNIIKKMIFQTVFGAGLKKLQTDMYASMGLQADGTTPIEGQPKKPDGTELIDFSWIDDLKKYNQENKDKTAEFNRLMEEAKAAGYLQQAAATTSSGISKGIQALTEDTGRRLEGLINSIRETSVMNMGNTKQLVESSQMIQGYAAQSLGHLRNIDMTTSEQLKLLNSVVFSGHSKGGAGIKTFTD